MVQAFTTCKGRSGSFFKMGLCPYRLASINLTQPEQECEIIVLRRTDPNQPRPFRTPWVPLVPVLGIIFNGYMMYELGWLNWARLIIWLAIGLVIYFVYGSVDREA